MILGYEANIGLIYYRPKDAATMSLKSTGNRKTLAGEIMEITRKEMKI